jgi:hypothetical protein
MLEIEKGAYTRKQSFNDHYARWKDPNISKLKA